MIRLVTILALALAACTTPQPAPEPPPAPPPAPAHRLITINIHTLPPGAIIYMNAEFIGTTPLQYTVAATPQGTWLRPTRFQAYVPHDTGNYEEAVFGRGYEVPRTLLLRVPGYTQWYSATQRVKPTISVP